MTHLTPGSALEVLGPLGNGFTEPEEMRTALIVAGGMGVAPLRGLIHQCAQASSVQLHVFFGAQSAANLLFLDEIAHLGTAAVNLSTEDGSLGHQGLVTDLVQRSLQHELSANPEQTCCFACGPWPLLQAVARMMSHARIACQVALESRMACGIGACLGCAVKRDSKAGHAATEPAYARVCMEGPVFDAQEIAW